MSMSDVFYLGVYVEVGLKATKEYEAIRGCPNKHFIENIDDGTVKFCPECGSKIEDIDELVSTKYEFDYYDLFELTDENGEGLLEDMDCDTFSLADGDSANTIWLVHNLTSGPYGRFLDEDCAYGAAPLDLKAGAVIEKFTNEFGTFIEVLREHTEYVTIQFGLVHWYR